MVNLIIRHSTPPHPPRPPSPVRVSYLVASASVAVFCLSASQSVSQFVASLVPPIMVGCQSKLGGRVQNHRTHMKTLP